MKAEIELRGAGIGTIKLDGTDMARGVRGFVLSSAVGQVTELVLDVVVIETTRVSDEHVSAHIPAVAHDLLIELGWTPPPPDHTSALASGQGLSADRPTTPSPS